MTDEVLRIGVIGARGRMGSEVCLAVDAAADLDLCRVRKTKMCRKC